MSGISTWAALRTGVKYPHQRMDVGLAAIATAVSGRAQSLYKATTFPGATPTTAAVPTASTVGALRDPRYYNPATANRMIAAQIIASGGQPGLYWLIDRSSHQGGLSGIVTGTQSSTNLPTAALTRNTGGVQTWAALEIYTQLGATATTATVIYTDNAGNASQTSPAFDIGGTTFREVGRMILVPLLAGDSGVRAVSDVQLVASTLTAGNFGVTLFQVLAQFQVTGNSCYGDVLDALNGAIPYTQIPDDACLSLICFPHSATTGTQNIQIRFVEDP